MAKNLRFPFFIGRRLTLGNDGSKSAPAVKVAIVAVALSIAVMIASIAIVQGFKREIRQKVIGFNSHLTIYSVSSESNPDEQPLVSLTPSLKKILEDLPFITSYSLEVSVPSMLKTENDYKGVYFKGKDTLSKCNFLSDNLVAGSLKQQSNDSSSFIAISQKAADRLNLKTGDRVDTYFVADNIKVRPLRIGAVFNSHFDVYDDIYVYGQLSTVQDVASLNPNEGSALQILTDDFERLEEYEQILKTRLDKAFLTGEIYREYQVESVYRQGAGYFQWLSLLDTNVIVVLILMAVVTCVTLISGILILILDKVNLIGTLKALGASNKSIRSIFIYLAMKVAVIGMLIGNGVIILLLWLQHRYRFIPLDPDNYYIDFVPVDLDWYSFLLLNIIVLILIFLTLLIPARFVATIRPAVTIRYE